MTDGTVDGVDGLLLVHAVRALAAGLRQGLGVRWLPGGEVSRAVAATNLRALAEARAPLLVEYRKRAAGEDDGAVAAVWTGEAARLDVGLRVLRNAAVALHADGLPPRLPVTELSALDVEVRRGRVAVRWALRSRWGWLVCDPVEVPWSGAADRGVPSGVVAQLAALLSPSPMPGPSEEDEDGWLFELLGEGPGSDDAPSGP